MAVKHGHASYDRVGEIHDDVYGTADCHVDGVEPARIGNGLTIFPGTPEVHLVNVYRMNLA